MPVDPPPPPPPSADDVDDDDELASERVVTIDPYPDVLDSTAPYSSHHEYMMNRLIDQETHERIMKAPIGAMTKGGRS